MFKDYSPLKVNYKLIYEREGLVMNNNQILNESKKLSKKYNKKEKMFLKMFEMGINAGKSIEETKILIEEFENSNNCY